jgi:hypothetical protein
MKTGSESERIIVFKMDLAGRIADWAWICRQVFQPEL